MTNVQNAVRSILVYALVIPLALLLGYLLAARNDSGLYVDMSTWGTVLGVLFVFCVPLLLKWHHPLLLLSWNMLTAVIILPGTPPLWFVTVALSLTFSIVERALDREMRFVSAPSLIWPLAFLAVVVFLTGHFTGGFGTRVFGGGNYGGKRYWLMFGAMAGFFAITAHAIPRNRAWLYVGLFFLGSLANGLSSLIPWLPKELWWLSAIFPVSPNDLGSLASKGPVFGEVVERYAGLTNACMGLFFFLLARFGVKEMLGPRTIWRFALLAGVLILSMFGGFRSALILLVLTFVLVFYFEGLFRTKYGAIFIGALILGSMVIIPFTSRLPLPVQRSLTVLPLDLEPAVRYEAQGSTEWRLKIWGVLLPEVPRYFWGGKGLSISGGELELTSELVSRGAVQSEDLAMMAGDYHSGPLSVMIPFGVWGAIGWLWFLGASIRALYLNRRYGDESLQTTNTFLLAYFIARTILFFFVFGDFSADLLHFIAIVGISLCLNGGIRRPVRVAVRVETKPLAPETMRRPLGPAPALPRSM